MSGNADTSPKQYRSSTFTSKRGKPEESTNISSKSSDMTPLLRCSRRKPRPEQERITKVIGTWERQGLAPCMRRKPEGSLPPFRYFAEKPVIFGWARRPRQHKKPAKLILIQYLIQYRILIQYRKIQYRSRAPFRGLPELLHLQTSVSENKLELF